MGFNKVMLLGNLGKDPELVQGTSTPICKFSLATGERKKDQSGNWVDHTEWHSIVTFGNTAENCAKFLKKGRQVFIEGKISTRKWQDKEGKDRYTTEILANTVQFIGSKGDYAGGGSGYAESGYTQSDEAGGHAPAPAFASVKTANGGEEISFDDDIPF